MGLIERLYDPDHDVTESIYVNDDGELAIHYSQDTEPIIQANRELNNSISGYTPSRDLFWAARIPNGIAHQWLVEKGINVLDPEHAEKVNQLLDSPEWAWLRVGKGRLSGRPSRAYYSASFPSPSKGPTLFTPGG